MGSPDGKADIERDRRATEGTSSDIVLVDSPSVDSTGETRNPIGQSAPTYRVYKRRFFGLAQLVLLNIVVSWDWLSFSAVSTTSAEYFKVSEGTINWLSTGFLFAFTVATPATIWTLNQHGPKASIVVTAVLLLIGNWIRYGGTKANNFGVVVFGQILIGLSQPFCLAAPTRYSDLWFSDRGRVSATAIASLANPFGGALGQLIDPFWATKASDIPNMVLWISIISSIACVPSFFVPAQPPTPPSAASASSRPQSRASLLEALRTVLTSLPFWLIAIPFWIYVALFNSISSLLNQILSPYSLSETDAGIDGALLIVVGLVAAAILSPIIDRSKKYLLVIKIFVPLIAICYLVFIWAPGTRGVAAPYIISSLLGASSFCVVPIALEYLVEIMYPVSPEISSTICWSGGQLTGAIFIVIENSLKAGPKAHPPSNMHRALIFQAVIAMVVVPLPLSLGWFGIQVTRKRLEADRHASDGPAVVTRDEETQS